MALGALVFHFSLFKFNAMCVKGFAVWFLRPSRFLSDYDEQFPIADDVSLLQQALPVMYPYQLFCNNFV